MTDQSSRQTVPSCFQAASINSNERSSPLNAVQPYNFIAISPSTPSITTFESPYMLANNVIPMAAGTLAFAAILSLSTLMQLKLFRISTGSPPPIPSMIGFGSVAAAAAMSHVVSIKAFQIVKQDSSIFDAITKPFYDFHIEKDNVAHLLRVSAIGLLAYKRLGGRF